MDGWMDCLMVHIRFLYLSIVVARLVEDMIEMSSKALALEDFRKSVCWGHSLFRYCFIRVRERMSDKELASLQY